jgi:hypothetical protein
MRIWSLHPKYLDRQGLLACWRETLLAQKVLRGETRGYRQHPQLIRFRTQPDPLAAIAAYLAALAEEAGRRGYRFDQSKIVARAAADRIPVGRGQLLYEWEHLKQKLRRRDPARYAGVESIAEPEPHPLFSVVAGPIEAWEKSA